VLAASFIQGEIIHIYLSYRLLTEQKVKKKFHSGLNSDSNKHCFYMLTKVSIEIWELQLRYF